MSSPSPATPIPTRAEPVHEWVSFESDDGETYVFDVTFLTSAWTCIFGQGCLGVLDGPAPELVHGCCLYGAHFSDKLDVKRVRKAIKLLTSETWQFKKKAKKLGGPITVNDDGDTVISTFAALLRQNTRDGIDSVVRYGGEEFLMILPETDLAGGVRLAERLRTGFAATGIASASGEPPRISRTIASRASALATSPYSWPPMPSATSHSPSSLSP